MNDDKKLIWVKKELAEEYEKLDGDISKSDMVNEIIRRKKIDIGNDIECLEDDLIKFKGFSLNYASKFQEAYNDQEKKIYKIWEDCQEPINKIHSKTNQIEKEIGKLQGVVVNIATALKELDTYKLERVIKIIEQYNSMSDDDKGIFKLILNAGE